MDQREAGVRGCLAGTDSVSKLRHLVGEVEAAFDIHLAGRSTEQFNRTVFILVDDAVELAAKLYLIERDPDWSERRSNGRFKNFGNVIEEVRAAIDDEKVTTLLVRAEGRRRRRNEFFHSTHLLDLTIPSQEINLALVDLFDLGSALFPDWGAEVEAAGNLETADVLVRLDCRARSDPSLTPRVMAIFAGHRRASGKARARGCEVVFHPEDHHLRLAVRNGGKVLRDTLRGLLNQPT